MTDRPDWAPPGVDTTQANAARVYDYWLGGDHNFQADQDLGRAMGVLEPDIREITRASRAFLGRAVRFLAASGIRQFLDLGSGIPTQGNVHEIAQQAAAGARVAYADIDPDAVAHSRALLAADENTVAVQADLREPEKILANSTIRGLIDFREPVALLLAGVLPLISDAEGPGRIVATLRDAVPPGSYLVISHGTDENDPARARAAGQLYNPGVPTPATTRSRVAILRLFDGFDLVAPGLVEVPQWRPDSPAGPPASPGRSAVLAGVGRRR